MKKLCILFMLLALSAGMLFTLNKKEKSSTKLPNHQLTSARLSVKNGDTIQLAWAVAYSISTEKVRFITVAHAIKGASASDLFLHFASGTVVQVESVSFAKNEIDLAFVSVAKSKLQDGVDYVLQEKGLVDVVDQGKVVYLLGEEVYGQAGTFRISSVKQGDDGARYFLIPGRVDEGRSGSPVFHKDTSQLLGIIQGYYPATATSREVLQAVSVYQAERNFR